MPLPKLRVCFAPNEPGETRPTRIRFRIGRVWRDIRSPDARQIADRIHDLCDRLDATR